MADNKKYYYLKVKDNFYDSEEMIILQNMQDGYLYSDILMKLYLRSLKNNGKLMFKDVIPYTPSALAQVVRHQVGTVEKALKIFQKLGLIEVLDNGAIYMLDIQNFIGESSTEADRIRKYRAKIKEDKDSVQMLQQMYDKCTPEIEIEKEIDIKKDINSSSSIYNKDVAKIDELMIECLNTTNTNNINECIEYLDKLPIDVIEYALKKTSRIDRPSWKYAMSILDSYVDNGITTLEKIKVDELNFKSKNKSQKKEETFEEQVERYKREWGLEDED